MLWKELHGARRSLLLRIVGGLVTGLLGTFLIVQFVIEGEAAIRDWWWFGKRQARSIRRRRRAGLYFAGFLRVGIPLLYVAAVFAVASAAAAGVTSEREDDTWTSLTTTDLTGREIVSAKLLGALWNARRIVFLILVFAGTGGLVGSVHPVGVAAALLAVAVNLLFVGALGVRFSLAVNSTWRAQILTIGLFFIANLLGQAILGVVNWRAPMVFPGFTPVQVNRMLVEPYYFEGLARAPWPKLYDPRDIDDGPGWTVAISLLTLVAYGVGACLLWRGSLSAFEVAAGRARRSRKREPKAVAGAPVVAAGPAAVGS